MRETDAGAWERLTGELGRDSQGSLGGRSWRNPPPKAWETYVLFERVSPNGETCTIRTCFPQMGKTCTIRTCFPKLGNMYYCYVCFPCLWGPSSLPRPGLRRVFVPNAPLVTAATAGPAGGCAGCAGTSGSPGPRSQVRRPQLRAQLPSESSHLGADLKALRAATLGSLLEDLSPVRWPFPLGSNSSGQC